MRIAKTLQISCILTVLLLGLSPESRAQFQDPFTILEENGSDEEAHVENNPPNLGMGGGEVPVDGGLSLLLAAGSVLGYRQVRKRMG